MDDSKPNQILEYQRKQPRLPARVWLTTKDRVTFAVIGSAQVCLAVFLSYCFIWKTRHQPDLRDVILMGVCSVAFLVNGLLLARKAWLGRTRRLLASKGHYVLTGK